MKLQNIALHCIIYSQKLQQSAEEVHAEHKQIFEWYNHHIPGLHLSFMHMINKPRIKWASAHFRQQRKLSSPGVAFKKSFPLLKLEWISLSLHSKLTTVSHQF